MAYATKDNLESFAKRCLTRLRKGDATDSMERQFCRLLTSDETPGAVKAKLLCDWVGWSYGKPTERIEHSGTIDLAVWIEGARKRTNDAG